MLREAASLDVHLVNVLENNKAVTCGAIFSTRHNSFVIMLDRKLFVACQFYTHSPKCIESGPGSMLNG